MFNSHNTPLSILLIGLRGLFFILTVIHLMLASTFCLDAKGGAKRSRLPDAPPGSRANAQQLAPLVASFTL
jgi:hypothetical protein